MDIGPGDCLEALVTCGPNMGCRNIVRGSLYYIRNMYPGLGDPCFLCHEVHPGFNLMGDMPIPAAIWCPCGFRPYHGPEVEAEKWAEAEHQRFKTTHITWGTRRIHIPGLGGGK